MKLSSLVLAATSLFSLQSHATSAVTCFETTYSHSSAYYARNLTQDQKVDLCVGQR